MNYMIHPFRMVLKKRKEENKINKNHKMSKKSIEFSQEERIYLQN